MIFQPEPYLNNPKNKEERIYIKDYNACFNEEILICHNLFYFFIVGNYYELLKKTMPKGKMNFAFNDVEKLNYFALKRLLESIKKRTGKQPMLYITPHIFTKFVHLLRKNIIKNRLIEDKHYKNILNLLKEEFGHVEEEFISKDEIIEKDYFNKQLLGLTEATILILKDKKTTPCILASSGKIFKAYDKRFLWINFSEVLSIVKEELRRQRII